MAALADSKLQRHLRQLYEWRPRLSKINKSNEKTRRKDREPIG
jgi:hypothetical protein